MKKGFLLFLAVAVLLVSFALVGCGGDKKESAPAAKPAQPAAPAAKEESIADLMKKGGDISGLSYDYSMESKEVKMTGKIFKSGKKIRSEMTANNQKVIMISDAEAKVVYNYMPDQNIAMKMPFDPQKTTDTPDKYSKETDAAKVKVLETTTYDGVKCKVILAEPKDSKVETKMWIREDYGLPMKIEMTTPDGKMTMEYKNLKIAPQPAELFQIPAGAKIMDAGEMMKNIPGRQ